MRLQKNMANGSLLILISVEKKLQRVTTKASALCVQSVHETLDKDKTKQLKRPPNISIDVSLMPSVDSYWSLPPPPAITTITDPAI